MNKEGPTFLGIGVQKSATTWLAHMLREHPDIFIPPAKEIHFFDSNPKYHSPNYLNYDNLLTKFNTKEKRRFHVFGILAGVKWLLKGKISKFIWRLKFHLNTKPTISWYKGLFKTKKKYIAKGEITPAYALLNESDIKRIKALNPELKIIAIFRNPIERSWSFIRWEHSLGHININNRKDVEKIINSNSLYSRNAYSETLTKWWKYFDPSKLLILYYADIKEKPKETIKQIFNFLDVSEERFSYDIIGKPVAATKSNQQMPDWVVNLLSHRFYNEMETFANMLESKPRKWFKDIESKIK